MSSRAGCRFVALDRGTGHIHRYTPSCSCGWIGRHRRTIAEAKRTWRTGHDDIATPYRQPDPLTPTAELPEVLR